MLQMAIATTITMKPLMATKLEMLMMAIKLTMLMMMPKAMLMMSWLPFHSCTNLPTTATLTELTMKMTTKLLTMLHCCLVAMYVNPPTTISKMPLTKIILMMMMALPMVTLPKMMIAAHHGVSLLSAPSPGMFLPRHLISTIPWWSLLHISMLTCRCWWWW